MARAIWSGSISFGQVNVPVRMYSAVAEHDHCSRYLHVKDSSRIGYVKVCKREGSPSRTTRS
jgi:DNA end-binding protein Ku